MDSLKQLRWYSLAVVLCSVLAGAAYLYLIPQTTSLVIDDQEQDVPSIPSDFYREWNVGTLSLDLKFQLHNIYPRRFSLYVDACLKKLLLNGHYISVPKLDCTDLQIAPIDIGEYLQPGENTLSTSLNNRGGWVGLILFPSLSDRFIVAIAFLLFVLPLLCIAIRFRGELKPHFWGMAAVLGLGSLWRFAYVVSTPLTLRQHDIDAHTEYISWVLQNWSIPDFADGQAFFHPPLYYFLCALLMKFCLALGLSQAMELPITQVLSFVISTTTLLVVGAISCVALPEVRRRWLRLLFVGLIAFLPGAVFQCARIHNDPPAQLLIFCSILSLAQWWHGHGKHYWLRAVLFTALACLTKMTAASILGPLFILCLLNDREKIGVKFRQASTALIILAVSLGGFLWLRHLEGQKYVVGNIENNNPILFSKDDFYSFTVLNPLKTLEFIYNDPWADNARRRFMWEYTLRSALFGEYKFPAHIAWASSGMLLAALQLLLLGVWGLYREIKCNWRESAVWWSVLLCGCLSKVLIRLAHANGGLADFRYTVFLALPVAYFVVKGVEHSRPNFKTVGTYLCLLFTTLCAIFLTYLWH